MILRLGLMSTRDADLTRTWVRCSAGTTWSTLRTTLRTHGVPVPPHGYVAGEQIRDDALVGTPPLLHEAVITDRPTPPAAKGLIELVVTEGPDTGARCVITSGHTVVGRDPDAHLRLRDPDVSRRHCVIAQDQGRLTLFDDRSTNGTHVGAEPAPPGEAVPVRIGARIRIGRSTLVLSRKASRVLSAECDGQGHLLMHRSPRRTYPPRSQTITAPTAPADATRRPVPWAMILLPLVLALAMVLVFHNAMFLMFSLLSPAMVLGQYLSDRRGTAVGGRHTTREYERAKRRFDTHLAATLASEVDGLRASCPTLTELADLVRTLSDPLWQREPSHEDFLVWRVGVGDVASRCLVRRSNEEQHHTLSDAPETIALREHRVCGVCGDARLVERLTASLVLQLTTLHSPRHLRLIVLCDGPVGARRWQWALGLPHLQEAHRSRIHVVDPDSAQIKELTARLARRRTGEDEPPDTVLLLDPATVCTRSAALADLVSRADEHGLAVVAIAERRDHLPHSCTAVVEARQAHRVSVSERGHHRSVTPDLPSTALVIGTARRLAAIVDASPDSSGGSVPDSVDLIAWYRGTHGVDLECPDSLGQGWRERGSTVVELGAGDDGPVSFDLAVDGPHALVAGTTGSGKSELLQTLITSLAATNRPDQLAFVLIDYKGGAAFKDCSRLPHTVGMVTDLDGHLTSRALQSLEAELRRRERLLAGAGAKDITDYTGRQPIPRLVLVIDEFRVLAEELPDFIAGLVRIATVGRSLGIHLVLATQRPAGIVSPEIRANVNLRIALRVRDESDSQDVIGTGHAARISSAQPGRAYLRAGGTGVVTFQTARVGGASPRHGRSTVVVGGVEPISGGPRWPDESRAAVATDLQRIAEAMIRAWRDAGGQSPPSPWLPPLPELSLTSELRSQRRDLAAQPVTDDEAAWPLALMDLPAQQQVATACWCPDTDGQLAVVGGPRSGRTTSVSTVAAQACRRSGPDALHLYVLDADNTLAALASLPHCGAHLGRDDVGLISRMCAWLLDEIRRRQATLASGAGLDADRSGVPGSTPRILLVIDGWEAFAEVGDEATGGRMMDDLGQIIRDGAAVGIYAVVTGGRAVSSSRVSSLFSRRIALRMPDETDLLMLGLRSGQLPGTMPPGRAVLVPEATELHVAVVGEDASPAAQAHAIRRIADTAPPATTPPRRFRALPHACSYDALPAPAPGTVPIGLGGDDQATLGFPTPEHRSLVALVAGPPRSGRTTTLAAVARGLAHDRATAYVGRDETDSWAAGLARITPTDADTLAQWCTDHDAGVLLVDDIDELLGTPTEEVLLRHLARLRTSPGALVAAGNTTHLDGLFRGLVPELRRHQTGVLLHPGRHDGDLLGVTIGALDRARPGHGVLVLSGDATEIQVAQQFPCPGSGQ